MNESQQRSRFLPVMAVLAVAVVLVIALKRPPDNPEKEDKKPTTTAQEPTSLMTEAQQKLQAEATQLQQDQKWCDAGAAWKKLLAEIPHDASGELQSQRQEAEHNSRLCDNGCQPPKRVPAKDERVEVAPPKENPPPPISGEDLLTWYPLGKTVRSVGWLHISGRGTNSRWVFKAESHFQYVYRLAAETKVVKNDSGSGLLTFEQTFLDVSQSRAVSRKTLEFSPPQNLLLSIGWTELERQVLNHVPVYVVARKLASQLDKIDPKAKRTLTWFQNALRQNGVEINNSDEIEFVTVIERVAGAKLRIEYATGLGVIGITRLDGVDLSEDELTQLAHASTVLMDYYLFPAANKKVGETWDVRASDVAQMVMPLAVDTVVDGSLTLTRLKDESADVALLKAVRGDLLLRNNDQLRQQHGRLTIKSGSARFSKADHLIRSARLTFDADLDVQGRPDFLLFGTKAMRDIEVDSRYESEVVPDK